MARKVGKSPKLQPVWEGPFIITKRYGPVLYEVQRRKTSSVLHHDRLKSYKSDVPGWVAKFNLNKNRKKHNARKSRENQQTKGKTHTPACSGSGIIKPPDRLNL